MRTQSRCRAYREGVLSRLHTYKCRGCGQKFQVDVRGPLPEKERICGRCRKEKTP